MPHGPGVAFGVVWCILAGAARSIGGTRGMCAQGRRPIQRKAYKVTIIQLDNRGRISLGRIATSDTYVVTVEDGGRIILEPATVLTFAEERALSDEGLRARVAEAFNSTGPTHPQPSRRSAASPRSEPRTK